MEQLGLGSKAGLFIKAVECSLSDEELIAKMREVIDLNLKITAEEAEFTQIRSEKNKIMKDLRAARDASTKACDVRRETRDIECFQEVEEATNRMVVRRGDTKEIVDERALTFEELNDLKRARGEIVDEPAASDTERPPADDGFDDEDEDEDDEDSEPEASDEPALAAEEGR